MQDDEPLDDDLAVGKAAAAATTKVVQAAATDIRSRPLRNPVATERRAHELAAAERWAGSHNPDRLRRYYVERHFALSGSRVDIVRLRGAEASLVEDWRRTGAGESSTRDTKQQLIPAYDSEHRGTAAEAV